LICDNIGLTVGLSVCYISNESHLLLLLSRSCNVCAFMNSSGLCQQLKETSEQSRYNIEIFIKETKKVGDGMNAYMTYKVVTKVSK